MRHLEITELQVYGTPHPQPDFNGDGFADLAVGVPGENVGSLGDAGAVHVMYGSGSGLSATGGSFLSSLRPGA